MNFAYSALLLATTTLTPGLDVSPVDTSAAVQEGPRFGARGQTFVLGETHTLVDGIFVKPKSGDGVNQFQVDLGLQAGHFLTRNFALGGYLRGSLSTGQNTQTGGGVSVGPTFSGRATVGRATSWLTTLGVGYHYERAEQSIDVHGVEVSLKLPFVFDIGQTFGIAVGPAVAAHFLHAGDPLVGAENFPDGWSTQLAYGLNFGILGWR